MSAGPFESAQPLLLRLSVWTDRSWRHPAGDGRSRADLVFDAVQQLADLAADAEAAPRRTVPRIDRDGHAGAGLVDQLMVMTHDLERTGDQAAIAEAGRILAALGRRFGF